MGKIYMAGGGGGGASSDECTLTRASVPIGLKAVTADSDDEVVEGTLDVETTLTDSQALSGQTYLKFDPVTKLIERKTGNQPDNGAINATLNCGQSKSIPAGFTTGGTVTANSLSSQTGGTATAAQILSGKTAWVNGNKITGTIPSQSGGTLTPSTSAVTASCSGKYMTGNYTIPAFSLPPAGNIKKGTTITIYGKSVTGTFEGYTTSPLYLFNNGTWSNLQTTGVTSQSGYDITLDGKIWLISSGSNNNYSTVVSTVRLNQTFDLTNYKYLKINFTTIPRDGSLVSCYGGFLGVSTKMNLNMDYYSTALDEANNLSVFTAYTIGSGIMILNISSLIGSYYIYMGIRAKPDRYRHSGGISQLFLTNA